MQDEKENMVDRIGLYFALEATGLIGLEDRRYLVHVMQTKQNLFPYQVLQHYYTLI